MTSKGLYKKQYRAGRSKYKQKELTRCCIKLYIKNINLQELKNEK